MRLNTGKAVILVAALAMAGLTARLGWWQLDRAAQKTALQAALDERRALPPLDPAQLADDAAGAALQHHRRIVLAGQWAAQATVYLENRQMKGRPGFFVVTPLLLPDGTAVVVQRGWQPRDLMDRTRVVPPPTPAGPVQVTGRIAPPPARLYEFTGVDAGPIRQNLDVDAYGREWRLRLRPLSLLQEDDAAAANGSAGMTATRPGAAPPAAAAAAAAAAVPPSRSDGLLRDWLAPATGVHKHYGYAFQWFALSILTVGLYVWFQIIRPRRPSRRKHG